MSLEAGSQLTPDFRQSRTPDVLVADWERGKPAACNITAISPLTPAFLNAGTAAAVESPKHISNGSKCQELCRVCVPMAVETYGNWGREAHITLSSLASRLARLCFA